MGKKIVWIILGGIIIVAAVLRLWQLGHVPISPDWDEVSLGYNAYSILHTGRDEYGAFLPIVLRSFGDYKPALYAYLTIPSVSLFGLNVFATRLPSAILGIVTVFLTFFLAKELFKRNDIALLSAFLLAISPWHIQFSRVAFETNVGLFFNVFGAVLFLGALKKPWVLLFSAIVFALNPYVYQSEKVFTPLLVLFLVALFYRELIRIPKKWLIMAGIIGFLVVLPMVSYIFFGRGALSRAQDVSIFSSTGLTQQANTARYLFNKSHNDVLGLILDNQRFIYPKIIIDNYLSHFDLNWLFSTGDIGRHHAPDMGLLYLWELPFILVGMYMLFFGKYDTKVKIFIFGWFLLAPVPAAITTGVPHAVRTLNFLPMYQIFTAIGIFEVIRHLKTKKLFTLPYGSILLGVFLVIALLNIAYYLDQYFVQLNYYYAGDWQYGYEKMVPNTNALGKGYEHIVVSSKGQFDESYMFFLFYLKYNPALYQKEVLQGSTGLYHFGKYIFRPINWLQDENVKNTLFLGGIHDFIDPVQGVKETFYNVDGTPLAKAVGNAK